MVKVLGLTYPGLLVMNISDDRLRVGIVGLGSMGRLHATRVRRLGHDLVGGVDISPAVLDRFETEFGVEAFEAPEQLFDEGTLDAVIVSTPNAFHAPVSVAALERDIAVLTEKPIAATLSGAEAVSAAARATDVPAMVGFHNRFAPSLELLEGLREEGTIGDIVHVEATYLRRRGIPDVSSWFTDASLAGGGALIDIGVHALDAALAAAGYPAPAEVSGVTRHLYAGDEEYADPEGWASRGAMAGDIVDVEDGATAFIRCEDGCTIHLDVAWACDRAESRTVRVQGTRGGATFDLGSDTLELLGAGTVGTDHYVDSSLAPGKPSDPHLDQLAYFFECVSEGIEPERNTIEEAMTVQRTIDGIYRSAASEQAVGLTELEPSTATAPESVGS